MALNIIVSTEYHVCDFALAIRSYPGPGSGHDRVEEYIPGAMGLILMFSSFGSWTKSIEMFRTKFLLECFTINLYSLVLIQIFFLLHIN